MPWLIALLAAAAATAYVVRARAASGKIVSPNALVSGRWYCVTAKVTPLVTPTTAGVVETRATVEAEGQGFVSPLAVIPAQSSDGTWACTVTGLYQGMGRLVNSAQMIVLQVEEVNPPVRTPA